MPATARLARRSGREGTRDRSIKTPATEMTIQEINDEDPQSFVVLTR